MSFNFEEIPNPPGSPNEKIPEDFLIDNVRPELLNILSNNPTKDEILRAFAFYDEALNLYIQRHEREFKYWANIHTHPGGFGGGGVGPEQWPEWLTAANAVSSADVPTTEEPVAKILNYVSNDMLTGIPTFPERIKTADLSGAAPAGVSISWFHNATRAVLKFPFNINGNWVILNATDPNNFYLEESHGWNFSRSARGSSIRVSPDDNWFAMVNGSLGSSGTRPMMYNIASGLWADSFTAHAASISGLVWSPDSTMIAGTSAGVSGVPRIRVWTIADGEHVPLVGIPTSGNQVNSPTLRWSPNGRYLCFAQSLAPVRVYDFQEDELITVPSLDDFSGGTLPHRNGRLFWSDDGNYLVSLRTEAPHYVVIDASSGTPDTWQRESGWPSLMTGTSDLLRAGAWSPLGNKLGLMRYSSGTGTSVVNVPTKTVDFTAEPMRVGANDTNLTFAGQKGNASSV